jgi:hypothetical protein
MAANGSFRPARAHGVDLFNGKLLPKNAGAHTVLGLTIM